MGLRFRKSVKIAPGIKLNIGKKSVGVSVGNKYGGVSINSRSGVTTRASIPGTGISYTKKVKATTQNQKEYSEQYDTNETSTKEINKWSALLLCLFFGVFGVHKFYEGKKGIGILYIFTLGLFGIGWIVDLIIILTKPNPYYV